MASFHTKTFIKHDDYITPASAWSNIKKFIEPFVETHTIYMPFYCDGGCGEDMKRLFPEAEILHREVDFFKTYPEKPYIVVDNPPFSKKKQIVIELKKRDVPFMLIMPSSTINTIYVRENLKEHLQIIIPRRRIQFTKRLVDGTPDPKWIGGRCNFECFYYCYKMGLEKDIIYLE